MNEVEFETAPTPERPRTATVLGLLVASAAILSYLGSYAMANALVSAEVLKPWPHDHDPRLRWFLTGFVILVSVFFAIGAVARFVSGRSMKQVEDMESEQEA
jgi:hypothetical protein